MTSINPDPGAFSPASTQGYMNLADGRRLSYTEWGHPAGKAVLEFRGLPSSRSGDAIDLDVLARARVRRITVDRPGLGLSDRQPGRSMLDWPTDVRGLADALGLETFAVLGTSGGGPYAAACGYALPQRVSRVVLVSGLGPLDRPGALDGMNRGEAATMILSRRVPTLAHWLVSAALTAERIRPRHGVPGSGPRATAGRPACGGPAARPRESGRLLHAGVSPRRAQPSARLGNYRLAVGFRPEDIDVPVHLYHGELDDRVPFHHARDLARRVPHCSLTEYPDEGHMLIFSHADEILIRTAAGSPS